MMSMSRHVYMRSQAKFTHTENYFDGFFASFTGSNGYEDSDEDCAELEPTQKKMRMDKMCGCELGTDFNHATRNP